MPRLGRAWPQRQLFPRQKASLDFAISAESGSYTVTGATANLLYARLFAAATAAYALTGAIALTLKGYLLVTAGGAYDQTGAAASLLYARFFDAATTSYSLTGATANLLDNKVVVAATGAYSYTGADATLTEIAAEAGDLSISVPRRWFGEEQRR